MVLTLYKMDASPPVRSVYMVIQALNITDVEYHDINLLQGDNLKEEYLKINPQHTIPTLVDDDFILCDSHAIATYLINVYGENSSLYPSEPKQRALIDQRLHFDSGILFPTLRKAIAPVIFEGETAFKSEDLEKVTKAYEFTEKFLTMPWLAGDEITVADICCVSSISTLNEILAIDESEYPRLADWLKRCSEQEFYKNGNETGLMLLREVLQTKLE